MVACNGDGGAVARKTIMGGGWWGVRKDLFKPTSRKCPCNLKWWIDDPNLSTRGRGEMAAETAEEKVGASADDDPPLLSAYALQALKEFLEEQRGGGDAVDGGGGGGEGEEVELVKENWRLSQFWYDKDTAEAVAAEVRSLGCSPVACVACPTLFAYLKKIDPALSVQLLEYDTRFEKYGKDFTFYDYNCPEQLPIEMKHNYPVVVADPPYLSKECLEKVAKTVSFLLKPGQSFLLLLTGEVQTENAAELLGLRPCKFRPCHMNKLGNEFRLFTNYNPLDRLGGWDQFEESQALRKITT